MSAYMTSAGMGATGSPHLGDDEMIRFIDNDGDDAWRADRDRHLASCPQCAREVEALAADAALFRLRVGQAAFEDSAAELAPAAAGVTPISRAPSRRSAGLPGPGWLRAAAVLLMLAAPVAAFPGLRAWIADTMTGVQAPGADVRTMSAPAGAADDLALIRFVPVPGVFAVGVDVAQAGGVFSVTRDDAATEAVFRTEPVPGELPAEPVVAESSLRLRNETAATASYSLVVPAGVTRVIVSVGGVTLADLAGTALRDGADLSLQPR